MAHPRIGAIPCPAPTCDNHDATVSETPTGTLNVNCHRCGFSGYGKAGTKAGRLIRAAMTADQEQADDAPAPTLRTSVTAAPAAPAAAAAPIPPTKPARAGFSLSQL